jgi:hypothetical protein
VPVEVIPSFFFIAKTFFPHHPGNWKYPSGLAMLMEISPKKSTRQSPQSIAGAFCIWKQGE